MKRIIVMLMIFLSHLAYAYAQNTFQYERIDFFSNTEAQEKQESETEDKQSAEIIISEWAEPIISPSGRVSVYVPPKEVRDFLEESTPENARAYLAWNLKRIKKFILAQELLRKETKELTATKGAKTLLESSIKDTQTNVPVGASYLFYFMLKGCSSCEKQARVIEDIYLTHPEIRIEAFAKGYSDRELENFRFSARQDNGISSLFKVKSYPAIAVFNKRSQRYMLSGFVDKERILSLFK